MLAQGHSVIQLSVVEQEFESRLSASTPPCWMKCIMIFRTYSVNF